MGQNPLAFFAQKFSGALSGGKIGQQGDLSASNRHGKDYWATYGTPAIGTTAATAGSVFRGSNQSLASLSAGLATTYTGLCLSNPAASTVNLVVKKVSATFNASDSAGSIGLITGWSAAGVVTHTTPITAIVNAYVGAATSSGSIVAAASQAKLDAACTIVGTPAWDRWLLALPATTVESLYVDLYDDLIVPPGGYVAIGGSVAEGSTPFFGTFVWEELPP